MSNTLRHRTPAGKPRVDRVMERLTGWTPRTSALDILKAGKTLTAKQAQHFGVNRRAAFSVAFITRVLGRYWEGIQPNCESTWPLPAGSPETDLRILSAQAKWLADGVGRAATQVDPATAGYYVGTMYAAALPPELRQRFGVYYTPPALAARLLDLVTAAGADWSGCTVLDPACGGGAFLAPVAQRIVKQLSHLEPELLLQAIAARVRGFEIDPVAAWMSQTFLEATLLPTCRAANRRLPVVVEVRDSLLEHPGCERYDVVVGNPPYGRVSLSANLRARYSASLYGHANLYGVFTERALRLATPGGLVAYVTPTSFLAGEYFKNLRRLLSTEAPPVAVDLISHRKGVFDDVLQEALLAIYRVGGASGNAPVSVLTPLDESVIQVVSVAAFSLPNVQGAPWLVPRNVTQAMLVERMRRMPHRLADWGYSVSTGPLVWNRHKNQLRRTLGADCLPLVWAEAITPEGQFVMRAAKANHEPYFRVRGGDDWLVITESCVLVQRTTAKEQSRRLIAAVLPSMLLKQHGGVVVENHLNMVRPLRSPPNVKPEVVAAFLNSRVVDEAFRCLSGSVAVSAYELEALPLPPANALDDLGVSVKSKASRETIDKICARLYGLDRPIG